MKRFLIAVIIVLAMGCGNAPKTYHVAVHLANGSKIELVTEKYERVDGYQYSLMFDSGVLAITDEDLAWVDVETPTGGKETWFSITYQLQHEDFNPNEITLRKQGYYVEIPARTASRTDTIFIDNRHAE